MCIYIHVDYRYIFKIMYTHIFKYVCIHIFMHIYIHIHMYIYVYTCLHTHVKRHVCTRTDKCKIDMLQLTIARTQVQRKWCVGQHALSWQHPRHSLPLTHHATPSPRFLARKQRPVPMLQRHHRK